MLDYGLPQKEKKSVMRGNVGAAATGLLQPTRLAVENPFNALQWKIHWPLAFMEDVCMYMCR